MKRYIQARTGKYYQGYVVQEYVPDYGWEDVCTYDDISIESWEDAKATEKDYINNGYAARIITRKFENPNYVEPVNDITAEEVLGYIKNECPYPIKEISDNVNYLIGSWGHCCQIFISDNTVRLYNIGTNKTKTIYTMSDMIQSIDKICKE